MRRLCHRPWTGRWKMGGNLVVAGTPEEIAQCAASYTGQFLKEKYL